MQRYKVPKIIENQEEQRKLRKTKINQDFFLENQEKKPRKTKKKEEEN